MLQICDVQIVKYVKFIYFVYSFISLLILFIYLNLFILYNVPNTMAKPNPEV